MTKLGAFAMMMVAAATLASGCGKGGGGGGTCGPLTVTVDGTAVEGMTHGFAIKDGDAYTIEMFNHDKTTCDQMLAGARQIPDGEKSVRISAGGKFGAGLGWDANTQMGDGIGAHLKTKPAKAGDPVSICVDGSFKLGIGPDQGKTLAVKGEATGTYCGERK